MANKVLSIYVGSDAIRIAEMQKNSNKTVVLSNAAEIAAPDNSVNDGYLVDITAIAEAIRTSIFGRGFTAKEVIFTVTSKKIASKDVEIPYVKSPKKLQQILQANSGEYFPMSNATDYVFAYSVLEEFSDETGRKCRVSAVAAPNDLIKCYHELADELKFTINSIDYFGNSVIQLLSMQMAENRTDLVLQIEKDATFVNVMRGKTLVLQRSVPYGKNAVINALMDVKKISEKDAKTLLSNESLLEQHVTAEEYAETVQYLVSGIGRVVEYHRTKNKNDFLQGIKIFGEGSAIAGIEKILERELGAPVQHFETLSGVSIKGQAALTAEEVLRYLPNIGAVIAPMNLCVEFGRSQSSFDSGNMVKLLRILFILVTVVMVVWVSVTAIQYMNAVNEKTELEEKIAKIEDIEAMVVSYESAKASYIVVKQFELSTVTDNEKVYQFICDFEEILPTDTTIDDVSIMDGDVTMTVTTGWHPTAKNEVADIMVSLQGIDYLSELVIPTASEEYRYTLIESYLPNGEPVFVREEAQPGEAMGAFITFHTDETIPDEYKQYTLYFQVQSTFDVICHIGYPESNNEVSINDGIVSVDQPVVSSDAAPVEGGAE